jgi:(S)-ureidoglycine aminohydrolase
MPEQLPHADYVSRSRGASSQYYYIITPENLVPNWLPHFEETIVCPLVIPRVGQAAFGQYLLRMNPEAHTSRSIADGLEHFLYVLEGQVTLDWDGATQELVRGGFAYLPPGSSFDLQNSGAEQGVLLWLKKHYLAVEGLAMPEAIIGQREGVERREVPIEGTWSQRLMPLDDVRYDFTMLILSYAPGVIFDQVEIHHQEHGQYMLSGQGVYHLAGDTHEVKKGDFIYMAPFCSQYYYATGWDETSYLLYKDMHRDGFQI